jgi:hypothetical protein
MNRQTLDSIGFVFGSWAVSSLILSPALLAGTESVDNGPVNTSHVVPQIFSHFEQAWEDWFGLEFRPGFSSLHVDGNIVVAVETDLTDINEDRTLSDFTVATGVLVLDEDLTARFWHEEIEPQVVQDSDGTDIVIDGTLDIYLVRGTVIANGVHRFTGYLREVNQVIHHPSGDHDNRVVTLVPMLDYFSKIVPREENGYIDPEFWGLIDHEDNGCLTRFGDPLYPGCAAYAACRDCCWENFTHDMWVLCKIRIGAGCLVTCGIGCGLGCLATGPAWKACFGLCFALCGGAGCHIAVSSCGLDQLKELDDCQYQCDRQGRIDGCIPVS